MRSLQPTLARALPLACSLVLAQAPGNLIENGAVDGPRGWQDTGSGASFTVDREAGAREQGSLCIASRSAGERVPHNWRQMVVLPTARRPPARPWAASRSPRAS
jgi:hypothetical protein